MKLPVLTDGGIQQLRLQFAFRAQHLGFILNVLHQSG